MDDTAPKALTDSEIRGIASISDIRDMWGAETTDEMEEFLKHNIYAVRFNYTTDSPGYHGDLFLLVGGDLGEPLRLIRDEGALVLLGEKDD